MTVFNECFKFFYSYKCIAISKIKFQNKENKFNDVAKRVRQRCEEGGEGRRGNGGGEGGERLRKEMRHKGKQREQAVDGGEWRPGGL